MIGDVTLFMLQILINREFITLPLQNIIQYNMRPIPDTTVALAWHCRAGSFGDTIPKQELGLPHSRGSQREISSHMGFFRCKLLFKSLRTNSTEVFWTEARSDRSHVDDKNHGGEFRLSFHFVHVKTLSQQKRCKVSLNID